MLLYDLSQTIHNNIYAIKNEMIEKGMAETINMLKHRILTNILYISKKYKRHHEIILCADSGSWRKEIYPNYKARRKLRRKSDNFPWDEFWEQVTIFENELNTLFPFNFIKVSRAEGDDVIGTMVNHIRVKKPNEEIIIISSDKDFKQLHLSENIYQFDPKTDKEMRTINPRNELMYLILKGDDSDDILNVRTTDTDTFINPDKRQKTMWKETKVWECINNNTVLDVLLTDPKTGEVDSDLFENFKRNRQLIDLSMTPSEIKQDIIKTYYTNRTSIPNRSKMDLLKFFISNNMKVMTNRIDEYNMFYKLDEIEDDDSIMNYIK